MRCGFRRPHVPEAVLVKLRRGQFAVDAEIDLHGLTGAEAKEALREFIADAVARRMSCVRVIHGKGRRSGPRGPVLKNIVNHWLQRSDIILAFGSARARRRRQRRRVRVAAAEAEARGSTSVAGVRRVRLECILEQLMEHRRGESARAAAESADARRRRSASTRALRTRMRNARRSCSNPARTSPSAERLTASDDLLLQRSDALPVLGETPRPTADRSDECRASDSAR